MKLSLIKTESGSLLLEGREPGETLEYYDVDGEGGKATAISFAPWNEKVEYVPNVDSADYDSDDSDSFWSALAAVLTSAQTQGVELPDHAAI